MNDVIIIGSGVAGMAASVYAAKNKLKVLVLDKAVAKSWPGSDADFFSVNELKKQFESLAKEEQIEVLFKQDIVSLEKNVVSFSVETKSGRTLYGKSVIITSAITDFDLTTHKNINGQIKVDSLMRTNIPGIFAAGDAVEYSTKDDFIKAAQGAQAMASAAEFLKSR